MKGPAPGLTVPATHLKAGPGWTGAMLHEAGCSGKSLGLGSGQSELTGQLDLLLALGPWARVTMSLEPVSPFVKKGKQKPALAELL